MKNVSLPMKPSDYIKEGLWTVEEDRRLSDYIQSYGVSSWLHLPDIAGLLRSGTSCRLRWLNHLNPAAERGDLTEEEQHLVIRSYWDIASSVPGKTDDDIRNFWTNYKNSEVVHSVKNSLENVPLQMIPSDYIKEGLWTVEEDRRLSDYIQSHGVIWWVHLPDKAGLLRSGTSCRLRWLNHRIPAAERGDLTEEEQHLVTRLIVNFGVSYSDIALRVPGKTNDEIRNFWTNYCKVVQKTTKKTPRVSLEYIAQMLYDEDETQNERDATCIEQNDTNVGEPYIITIPPTPQDDLHSESKGVVQVEDGLIYGPDQDLRNAQILNDEDETQNERDATCIEQNDTNVGQPYSITIPPTPQDDLHSENKDVVQVDSSENNDTAPNDSDYDDDDQNNNKTSLDTTHISKTPDYITSKISFSLEVLEQHFDMNMEDAAKSLNVSRSSLKRMCRANGINRWPCRKRKINHQQLDNPKTVNKLVQKNNNQMNQSTRTQAEIISPSGNASSTNSNVIIKATYRDDIIKFRLSVSSGVDELRGKIGKRLELEVRSFKLKYRDDAGDLVLINCDEDLHDCLGYSRSLSRSIDHKTTFDFLVFPVINNSG